VVCVIACPFRILSHIIKWARRNTILPIDYYMVEIELKKYFHYYFLSMVGIKPGTVCMSSKQVRYLYLVFVSLSGCLPLHLSLGADIYSIKEVLYFLYVYNTVENIKLELIQFNSICIPQKSEVHALHGALAEKDKYYASAGQDLQQQIKSQTHTIQILIEEKNQLEARLNASGDAVEAKNREMDELKGRLAISKHKSANMERDMMVLQEQMKQEKKLLQETTAALSQERLVKNGIHREI
jgi:hypothetical protein